MASRRAAEMSKQRWRGGRHGSKCSGLSGGISGARAVGIFERSSTEVMPAMGRYNEEKAAEMDFVV